MLKKRIMAMLHCLMWIGAAALTACQGGAAAASPGTAGTGAAQNEAAQGGASTAANEAAASEDAGVALENPAEDAGLMLQLTPLQKGEELVVLHTSLGDIKLRLFPTEAPKAVENFLTHAKQGYYDGVIFHRVINDFMIQTGDPEGTGSGGESIWGGGFASEFSLRLRHIRGALSMAHSSLPDSNGSQFYIVQNQNLNESYLEYFNELLANQDEVVAELENGESMRVRDVFPAALLNRYIEGGGTPHLDFTFNEDGHTVFGQVVAGMEVVDAIANVPIEPLPASDPKYGRPIDEVVITSVSFETVS